MFWVLERVVDVEGVFVVGFVRKEILVLVLY